MEVCGSRWLETIQVEVSGKLRLTVAVSLDAGTETDAEDKDLLQVPQKSMILLVLR